VALEKDPELNDLFQRMLMDFSLSDEFYRSLNEPMADSLQRFWDLEAMAAVQGVLGDRAKRGVTTSRRSGVRLPVLKRN
jgi:hypothetical protein